ncbi:hypothetical protein KIN20_015041 [Parelaphostrongylus tenuis]|uniref:Uncharacterized protein n=1 Tax=Parelaphostrongylus tenuis TaxID=148309 RepID=A0AAD5QPL0_PARTN|nr:hypothetical protein KIN20_015041 [Parelaphostrongylus tenuis]
MRNPSAIKLYYCNDSMMIRFEADESDDMSEEKRFYYLRLMAKPGRKPIKTKFVTWSPEQQSKSREDDPVLESQAMRVVRTIGQAFEVCHKVAQEQMLEKHEDEAVKSKASIASEDDAGVPLDVIEERGAAEESSRSQSPVEPSSGGPLYGRRLSLFQPRKASSASSSLGTAIDTTTQIVEQPLAKLEPSTSAVNPNNPLLHQQSQQYPQQQQQQQQTQQQLQQPQQQTSQLQPRSQTTVPPPPPPPPIGIPFPMQFSSYPISSSGLPFPAGTYPAPQGQLPSFPNLQPTTSLESHSTMYYPIQQLVSSSTSMPYGLSSPVVVSPYATLQLNIPPVDLSNPETNTLSRSLDQYNQQLIRSQLDQAQQSAQVAGCQVQLLRDQLTSETTARIEAQSRTHQLLNANRELLEQVQCLMQRLQQLETKITSEIHQGVQSPTGGPPTTSSPLVRPPAFMSYHEHYDTRLPSGSLPRQNFPYQVQPLADLRAGSLPPKDSRERRFKDDGSKTEPESNNEDTTDYSSSDQYEKSSKVVKSNMPSQYNVLMANPLADINLPPNIVERPHEARERDARELRGGDRKEDDEAQPGTSSSPQQKKTRTVGNLRGEMEFARMSFNTRLQQLLGSKEIEERIEEEDRDDETTPAKKKVDDDRKDDRRKKEKVTVESLFKPDQPSSDKAVTATRTTASQVPTCSNAIYPGPLASSSVVTAMYPPIRRPVATLMNRPKLDVVRKKTLRALSVEMDDNVKEENRKRAEHSKLKTTDVLNIEDYLNRNVDRTNPGDPTLTTRLLSRQGDGKLPNLPNGYP